MRWTPALVITTLIAPQVAAEFEPGDKVVVIRPGQLQTAKGSPVPLTAGMTLTVIGVDGDRLNVAAGREGTIDAQGVIPADKAEGYFSELIAKDPGDAAALCSRGRLRFERGQRDEAIADLTQSIQLEPSSEAHTFRGFARKRKGDKDQALADFNRAIELNPREALAWRVRGATWASRFG